MEKILREILHQISESEEAKSELWDNERAGLELSDVCRTNEFYQFINVPQRSVRYIKRLDHASGGKLFPLFDYKGAQEAGKYGCLGCLHKFISTPQKLSQNRYQCPICRFIDHLWNVGFDVNDEDFIEYDVDFTSWWTATCRSCGLKESAETVSRWKACRRCRINELYGGEFTVNDYSAGYADFVSVTHRKCGETYPKRMGYVLNGNLLCPYCSKDF